ncbi:hypothetical protein CPC08DRAFT_166680 [Agrocybe pediades]|nr:hypothetical protein CPC08DRAFT_166680 [Agrocybe pediades]
MQEEEIPGASQHHADLIVTHEELAQDNQLPCPIVRDFPVEILSEIFLSYHCLNDDEPWPPIRSHAKILLPLLLGAVCRSWRQVAWSTPGLWTHIYLTRSYDDLKAREWYTMFEHWIARSGGLLVNVFVEEGGFNNKDTSEADEFWNKSLQALARCADRWTVLDLCLSKHSFKFLWSEVNCAPPLNILALRLPTRYNDVADDGSFTTSHLSKLTLRRVLIGKNFPWKQANIDWTTVENIITQGWTWKECLDVLRMAPRLTSTHFDELKRPPAVEPSSIDVILHNRLLNLDIRAESMEFFGNFLDHITAPKLKSLFYESSGGPLDASLQIFLERSSCLSTSLELDVFASEPDFYLTILNTVPSLVQLNLRIKIKSPAMDHILQRLATVPEFLPCLQSLEYEEATQFSWDLLPDVFGPPSEFGKPGRRPLKRVIVRTFFDLLAARPLSRNLAYRLQALKEAGAVIEYSPLRKPSATLQDYFPDLSDEDTDEDEDDG